MLSVLLVGFHGQLYAEEPLVSAAAIDASIQKSLPYIEERGNWWIEKKECMSCHRVAFTAWSHVEAIHAGGKGDEEKVNGWIDWCLDNLFEPIAEKDRKYEGELTIDRNLSGAAQMLALAKNWNSTAEQKEFHLKIVAKLKERQMKDGKWDPKGQLPGQKRDLLETTHVITLWNALALINVAKQDHVKAADVDGVIQAAAKFVKGYNAGTSSEWLALRALFAAERQDPKNSDLYLKKLISSQNEDGGWGWHAGGESDALATGQVLYALIEMGHDVQSPEIQKTVKYLLANQAPSGVWKTKGTKKKAKDRFTETSNYWGTTWAVIGLSKVQSVAAR